MDPTLEDGIYNTSNKNVNKVDELVNILKSTIIKCTSNGIAKVVASDIALNNKMSYFVCSRY